MSSPEEPSTTTDSLAMLWAQVRAQPDEEARHRTFVTYAIESGRYLEAVDLYKVMAAEQEHADTARAWQERLAAQVAARLLTRPPDAAAQLADLSRRRGKIASTLGVIFCALAGLSWGRPFAAMGLVFGLPLLATGLVIYSRGKSK